MFCMKRSEPIIADSYFHHAISSPAPFGKNYFSSMISYAHNTIDEDFKQVCLLQNQQEIMRLNLKISVQN